MNERDLFDAFGRLPESYRLDALEHTEQQEQNETSEINAIFTETIRRNAGINAETVDIPENIQEESHCADVKDIQPPASRPKASPVRNFTIGVTAVAAAIALTVGIMVFRVKKEAEEAIGTLSASSSAESIDTDITEQTDSDLSGVTDTANETAADIIIIQEQTLPETTTTAQTASFFETNVFGGEGTLRVVDNQSNTSALLYEDDSFWYFGNQFRVSKTAFTENGDLYWQDFCPVEGCTHESPDCIKYQYAIILSDGESLYRQERTENGIGRLMYIHPDGTETPFFEITAPEILHRNDDAHLPYSVYIYGIQKLGSSGNYLITGDVNTQIGKEAYTSDPFALVYMSETGTGQKLFFPEQYVDLSAMHCWQYDAASDLLYLYSGDIVKNELCFRAFDVRTCEPVKESSGITYPEFNPDQKRFDAMIGEAAFLDGKAYFLENTAYAQDLITNGQVTGGMAKQNKSLYVYDFETNAVTLLQEDTDISRLRICDDRLLCLRNVRVGKDQIFFLDPEDMSEEIVCETPNKIAYIEYCPDAEHIFFRFADNGTEGMKYPGLSTEGAYTDGSFQRIVYDPDHLLNPITNP